MALHTETTEPSTRSKTPEATWKVYKPTTFKVNFWKNQAASVTPSREQNPAIQASPFPQPRVNHTPEWWHRPDILRGYCTPTVVQAIAAVCGQRHTSANLHAVGAVRADPSLRPIECFLEQAPTTADSYAALLPFFFVEREITRITARAGDVERRIRRLRGTERSSLTWWDLIREDLDAVLERAQAEYFAGLDDMWLVPRLVRRARQVTCSDTYRYREVKEWKFGEGKWLLEAMFPKVALAVNRLISEHGF